MRGKNLKLYFNIYQSIYLDEYLHFCTLWCIFLLLLLFIFLPPLFLGLVRKNGLNQKSSLIDTAQEADGSLSRRVSAINVCVG